MFTGPLIDRAVRADDPEVGFAPMFNGKDFTGWRFSDKIVLDRGSKNVS
jgi:hypothetical protein